jgi:tetratricopeptide (TPR) repeat protein
VSFIKYNIAKVLLPLVLFSLLAGGCSQSLYNQGRKLTEEGRHEGALDKYQKHVLAKPDDFRGWRELGVAYYQMGMYSEALDALQNAEKIRPDARTRLFVGLTHERQRNFADASTAFNSALELNPPPELTKRIEGRLEMLSSREEIHKALASASSVDAASIPSNTIAVYDFDGSTLGEEMAPLALGLAEFTAIDLSKIKALTVVERAKLRFLLQEMELAQSGLIDTTRAPQVGRILGSRNIVTGRVTSPSMEHLRLSGVIVNTVDSSKAYPGSSEEQLNKIFEMQKEFVRQIVRELGVELTPEELDSLEIRPTDSYEAFLAYCQGLVHQKNGQYEQALKEFRRALHLDKNFGYARTQLSMTSNLQNQSNFENFIQTQTIGGLTDLEQTLGDVIDNTGGIPNPQGSEGTDVTKNPPYVPTGAVRVKGEVDG